MVAAIFNCPIEGDWEGAEMYVDGGGDSRPQLTSLPRSSFVTLSMPSVPPPSDVFVPVVPLHVLDIPEHRKGEGSAAVCLPPLTGDLYARGSAFFAPSRSSLTSDPREAFIADYISYYQALGFEHFYAYMLDPGPQSLEAMRRVANADATVQPIRFALHQGLKYSATYKQEPSRNLRVDPSEWKLPGVGLLDGDTEFEMGGLGNGQNDIRLWYYGQVSRTGRREGGTCFAETERPLSAERCSTRLRVPGHEGRSSMGFQRRLGRVLAS